MKSAVLRPQALLDQQGQVRYYRKEGGARVAVRVANATNRALDHIEAEPGMGSPAVGKWLGIPGLRTWRVAKFPLLWCYFAEEYWGQGLASEAAQAILKYGFETLNLSRLICLIEPENIGSHKVAEKMGMRLEKKTELPVNGVSEPVWIYSIRKAG